MATPGSGNLQQAISDPLLTIRNKLQDVEEGMQTTQSPVSVGLLGDKFRTVQQAVDAGQYNLVISADITVTEDIFLSRNNAPDTFLQIAIQPDITFAMIDSVFTNGDQPTGRVSISVGAGTSTSGMVNDGYMASFRMHFTTLPSKTPFHVGHIIMDGVDIYLTSPVISNMIYINGTTLDIQRCRFTLDCLGNTSPVLLAGKGSLVRNVWTRDDSAAAMWSWSNDGTSVFEMCKYSGTNSFSSVRFGFPSSDMIHTRITDCEFTNCSFGSNSDATLWQNCTMRGCYLSNTPGTPGLHSDDNIFDNCFMDQFTYPPYIPGSRNTFRNCKLKMQGSYNLTIDGKANSVSYCRLEFGTGKVRILGEGISINFCILPSTGLFTAEVATGATKSKLFGNYFSSLVSDSGTDTQYIGNFPLNVD